MKRALRVSTALFSLGALISATVVTPRSSAEDNPYQEIFERNVFDLKPQPPPVDPNATPPNQQTLNVRLTGITTILDSKRALFMVKLSDTPGKPPNKEESYILSEGERQGLLEVLAINERDNTVQIKNDGVVSVVTFDKTKLPNAGDPGQPGGVMPKLPSFQPGFPGQPGMPGMARRRLGMGGLPGANGGGGNPFANTGGGNPYANTGGGGNTSPYASGMNSLPQRQVRTDPTTGADLTSTPDNNAAPLSNEEAALIMAANAARREQLLQQGGQEDPGPPLPGVPQLDSPTGQNGRQQAPAFPGLPAQ